MSYVDTHQLLSSPNLSTQVHTYGFAPGAIITFGGSATSVSDSVLSNTNIRASFGVSNGSTNQCQIIFVKDADSSNVNVGGAGSAAAAGILNVSLSTVDIDISWTAAFTATGSQWTELGTAAVVQRQHTLAIPASRISNSAVGTLTAPVGSGSVVTTIGFAADVVIFFYSPSAASTDAILSIGAAARSGAVANVGSYFSASDTGSSSFAESYSRIGDSLLGTSVASRGAVTSWGSTDFTATWSSGSGERFGYLALKAAPGFAFDVAAGDTRSDSEQIVLPFKNVRPDSAFFVSCCRPQSSAGTASSHAAMSLGAFAPAGTSTQVAMSILSRSGVDPSQVGIGVDYNSVYINLTNPPDTTLAGEMAVSSTGARHVALAMSDADPSASFFWALASGAAASRPRGAPIFF